MAEKSYRDTTHPNEKSRESKSAEEDARSSEQKEYDHLVDKIKLINKDVNDILENMRQKILIIKHYQDPGTTEPLRAHQQGGLMRKFLPKTGIHDCVRILEYEYTFENAKLTFTEKIYDYHAAYLRVHYNTYPFYKEYERKIYVSEDENPKDIFGEEIRS